MSDHQAQGTSLTTTGTPLYDRFRVGANDVDFASMRISRDSELILMEPKVLAVLRVLIDRAGTVVSRDSLIDTVWGTQFGGEERLSRAISLLRKALGDVRGQYEHIETIPKSGYRLIARVQPLDSDADTPTTVRQKHGYRRILMALCFAIVAAALTLWFADFPGTVAGSPQSGKTTAAVADGVMDNSIAVLPFSDLSPSGNQQYFSDGLAEEILAALAAIDGLSVAGRASSFAYRGDAQSIEAISTALGVEFLLTGSVRKQGDALRVTTQLVRGADGYHVWSKTFDGDLTDVFEFQESVARSIAGELSPATAIPREGLLARSLTNDREAYDLYLQGREMSRRFGRQEKLTAISLLTKAVELDSGFADAWAWLARSHLFIPITDPQTESNKHIEMARFAVSQALANDSDVAMGHYVNALLHDYDLNFDASLEAIERAYASAPNQPFFAIRRGFYHLALGYVSAGAAMIEEGLMLDPTDALGLLNLGQAKIHLGDIDGGLTLIERSASLGFAPAGLLRCVHLASTGRSSQSYQCWQELPAVIKSRYPDVLTTAQAWDDLGRVYAFRDAAAAQRIRAIALETISDPRIPMSSYLYGVLLAVGDTDSYLQSFVDRPFLLNASTLRLMWLSSGEMRRVTREEKFPAFAERLGFTRAWQSRGWPDYCHQTNKPGLQNDFYCE